MAATPKKMSDVMVIGAGVVGLACAFRLAREGHRVLLLDRQPPGMGASFGNAGHIATEQIFPMASPKMIREAMAYLFDRNSPLRIRAAYLLPILPWLARFVWCSRPSAFASGTAALLSLQQTAASDFDDLVCSANASSLFHRTGHVVLVEDAASMSAARHEQAALQAHGIACRWLPPLESQAMLPDLGVRPAGALHFTDSGHVDDPFAVCKALAGAFRQAGGSLTIAEVACVSVDEQGCKAWTVDGRRFDSRCLLIACGAWSGPLAAQLGYRVPIDTERGYQITFPGVTPQFQIPVASFERKVIMTPMSIGLRMTGTVEFGGLSLPADPHCFELLKKHCRALLPGLAAESVTTWMGFRPSLPDHLPVIGSAPGRRNLMFAFGHQHLGLTLAGVTARLIADLVAGRGSDSTLAPFAIDRF